MDIGYLKQSFSGDQVERLFQNDAHREALLSHYYPDIEHRIKVLMADNDWCETVMISAGLESINNVRTMTRWAFTCLTHLFGHQLVSRYLQEYPREFIGAGVVAATDGGLFVTKKKRGAIAEWIGAFACYFAMHRHEIVRGSDSDVDMMFVLNVARGFLDREIKSVRLRHRAFSYAAEQIFAVVTSDEEDSPPETPHTRH